MSNQKTTSRKTKMYYTKDADLKHLKDKTVAIIGCGSQGHAHALNLQESGIKVVVGLRKGSKTWEKAESVGLKVIDTSEAAKQGDIIVMLVPDTAAPEIYKKDIEPLLTTTPAPPLRKGGKGGIKSLVFAHGFNIHYKQIVPPKTIDVWMVAPKGPGHLVRSVYVQGFGVPALFAVHQDVSGKAKQLALAYGKAIGAARAGMLETTFKEETETDLFGEQVVLCGGISKLVQTAFEVLTEAGYQPELAYFECMHELKLIVDLMYHGGLNAMRYSVSDTAEWGDYVSGPRVITKETRKAMKAILRDIQSGKFAREWIQEARGGFKKFKKIRAREAEHTIEKVGAPLREMMRKSKVLGSGRENTFLEPPSVQQ